MNSCCSSGGGCCGQKDLGVQLSLNIGGCCCATNGMPMGGCCQVILMNYVGTSVVSTIPNYEFVPTFVPFASPLLPPSNNNGGCCGGKCEEVKEPQENKVEQKEIEGSACEGSCCESEDEVDECCSKEIKESDEKDKIVVENNKCEKKCCESEKDDCCEEEKITVEADDKCERGCCGESEVDDCCDDEKECCDDEKEYCGEEKKIEANDKCESGCCGSQRGSEGAIAKSEGGANKEQVREDESVKKERVANEDVQVYGGSLVVMESDCCDDDCCNEEYEDNVSLLRNGNEGKERTIPEKDQKSGCCGEKESKKVEAESTKREAECAKGCCGEKEGKKIEAESAKREVGCAKGCCGEKESKKIEAESEKGDTKCAKGCCGEKESKKIEAKSAKGDAECAKGCCGEKESKKIKRDSECGCCGEKEEKKTKEEEGCCGKEKGDKEIIASAPQEHSVSICCSVCWAGTCCGKGCCSIECCLTIVTSPATTSTSFWWPFSFSSSWRKLTNDDVVMEDYKSKNSTFSLPPSESCGIPSLPPPGISPDSTSSSLYVDIGGMTCTDCATGIQAGLSKVPGVMKSDITYVTGKGRVAYDASMVNEQKILQQIEKLGFTVEPISEQSSKETKFGISLPADTVYPLYNIGDLVNAIQGIKGVASATIEKHTRSLRVVHDFEQVSPHTLAHHIRATGWIPHLPNANKPQGNGNSELLWGWKWRFWVGTLLSIPVVLCAYILPSFPGTKHFITQDIAPGLSLGELISWICATPIQFFISAKLYESAAKSLIYARKANVDSLVMLSSSAAYLYSFVSVIISVAKHKHAGESFFETCAILLTLIMLGRYIETLAKDKTRRFLTGLVAVPQKCTVVNPDGTTEEEEIEWLGVGDRVLVVPGEKIPSDGIVVFGSSEVDESMLTGESIPVPKEVDAVVSSGSINLHGVLHVKVTKRAGESTLAKIRKLVEDAQASRANLQRITDTLASYFVPLIIVVAFVVFAVWLGVSGSLSVALRYAVAVLVVACPCALALAVPSAVMVGMEVGARLGVLYKSGGPALENLHSAQVVVFDKTGTLTRGRPAVISHHLALPLIPCAKLGGASCQKNRGQEECTACTSHYFFATVGVAESNSEHPVGRAIAAHALVAYPSPPMPTDNFSSVPGKGITCKVGKIQACVGSKGWMRENGIEVPPQIEAQLHESEKRGETVVCVGFDHSFAGSISLRDIPKPEAQSVVHELQRQGVEVWMMSGDSIATTNAVGQQLGIHHVHGGLLPGEKCDMIRELQAQGKKVVMVGDGINDSPSLAQANVGIAIGTGTDVAIEAADVVLMKDHLHSLVVAVDLSRKTFTRIKGNLAWSVVYNILALLLSSGILHGIAIPPSVAGASELVSSVPVLIASFFLNYYVPPVLLLDNN